MVIEEACIKKVNEWITEIKKTTYEKYIKPESSENSEGLIAYKAALESLEEKLSKAIQDQNTEALKELEWPDELMECINNMAIRGVILDLLHQAFTISHFNKSPKHEAELQIVI